MTNSVQEEINDRINSVAKDLGLHDFYSAHLLNFCEGFYTPTDMPNATVSRSDISKNVTSCGNRTAMYTFDPRETLQRELNASGHGDRINLEDLEWPSELDDGIHALEVASNAMFVLYCLGAAFAFVALVAALAGIFFSGRLSATVNIIIDLLAFLSVGIASAIATAIAVKATQLINDKGESIGISAQKGTKFLIITWVATALLLVASLVWCVDCVAGRRRRRVSSKTSDYGTKY